MKIAVIGTGYVGLVTGTCLAEIGHRVVCLDVDTAKIEGLRKGKLPIYEPGLDELVQKNHQAGRIAFTTNRRQLASSDAVFFAVPTPSGEDGQADLGYVLQAARDMAPVITSYTVFINKSTVPVGTSKLVRAEIAKHTKQPFDVVSNPEFLQEGLAIAGFMEPDRIVVGTSSDKARAVMEDIYRPLTSQGAPLLLMDEASAELTKYAANSFLATKVSFINEIANLCERVGANIDNVKQGMGSDKRIGKRFLNAGIGYGGSCFPKDIMALSTVARNHGTPLSIIEAARAVNESQQDVLVQKITAAYGEELKGKTFAVWGLAFKPNTDDIRRSPALHIVQQLLNKGAKIRAYDPEAMTNAEQTLKGKVAFTKSPEAAVKGADVLLVLTEWSEFASVPAKHLAQELKDKRVFDGRNMLDSARLTKAGLKYEGIGRR